MPAELTAAQKQTYLGRRGACCPYCESDQLESAAPTTSPNYDDVLHCVVLCLTCRMTWRDIYRLADATTLPEPSMPCLQNHSSSLP